MTLAVALVVYHSRHRYLLDNFHTDMMNDTVDVGTNAARVANR